jgi:isopenicillin N synthase-like dioxygenase
MAAEGGEPLVLPRVDLSAFLLGPTEPQTAAAAAAAAASLAEASSLYGAFYVTLGEGTVSGFTAPAFKAAANLFALPAAVKAAAVPESPCASAARGYIGCGAESGSGLLESKEAFSYAPDPGEGARNDLQAPNVWPASGETRHDLETFLNAALSVSAAVSRAMALALADDELERIAADGNNVSMMRLFHYFPGGKAGDRRTGSSPHTDWGMYTVIAQQVCQGKDAGLEVLLDGEWRAVPAVEDSLVVNCGDYMQLRTGGRWKSPLHRVVLSPCERTSLCFFQYPGYHVPMPRVTSAHASQVEGHTLSLLEDQSEGADRAHDGRSADRLSALPFGAIIAQKWRQVSRR